jgi:hypothetical protein
MPRNPNYKFERMERDRQKAAKKAARLEARKDKADLRKGDSDELIGQPEETTDQPEKSDDPDR